MYKGKTFLAVIPARGGSKRLPNKNILPFCGKPLLCHSVSAAKESKYIDEIVVSSDSEKILKIAKKCGSQIIKRPKRLAQDSTTTFSSIEHLLEQYKKNGKVYDYLVLLQPTSPLRRTIDIDNAIKKLVKKRADAVVSICEPDHSPLWSFKAKKNKKLDNIFSNKNNFARSQELDEFYCLNGSIYIIDIDKLLKKKTFLLKEKIYGYVMDKRYSIDIDDQIDFKLAEIIKKEIRDGK